MHEYLLEVMRESSTRLVPHYNLRKLHALQPVPVTVAPLADDHLARVRLGPIPDATTAYSTLDRLKRSGFSEAFMIAPEEELASSC